MAPDADVRTPGSEIVSARRLHPASAVTGALLALARGWPVLLVAIARSSIAIVAVFAVVVGVWQVLAWSRTTFSLGTDGLVVRSGVVTRQVRTVPPQRVQHVELRRGLRHRLLGVAVVRVELAGGSAQGGHVDLDALSVPDAQRLTTGIDALRRRAAGTGEPLPPPTVATPVLTVSTAQLFLGGITGQSLVLAPLAFVGVFELLDDVGLDDDAGELVERAGRLSAVVVAAIAVAVVLALAGASMVLRHHGLSVVRAGGDLHVQRGLLEQRSALVPLRRIQLVRLRQHALRAALGLAALDVRTAAVTSAGAAGEATALPIGRRADLERLVGELLPAIGVADAVRRPHPPVAVRRAVLRRGRALVPAAVVVGGLAGGPAWAGAAGVVAAVVSAVWGVAWGRRLRSGWTDQAVTVERGVVDWRREVVPWSRVQSVGVTSSPFQRRAGVVTVRLDVAGTSNGVRLVDLAEGLAAELVGRSTRQKR